jgi:dolichol-phosphate mannosyltransferase
LRLDVLTGVQSIAAAVVLGRLARGRTRRAPLEPAPVPDGVRVSVVIPARDEEARLGPCLAGVRDAHDVVVVDDRSSDATADVARAGGARVVEGAEPPPGWVGKQWALQQGVEAADGDVVVCLDADVRPRPGLLGALVREIDAGADWLTCGLRFRCDGQLERWLHASLLATLVYRAGPGDVERPARLIANGQCTAARRELFLRAGGYTAARDRLADDFAMAQALADRGWDVRFRDAIDLAEVDMHEGLRDVWREWGRSIALADVTPRPRLAADVAVVWLTMALPLARRRPLDLGLLGVRVALQAPLARAYARRGAAFWLAPLADPLAALRLTLSAIRPPRTWRGRTYA